MLASLRNASTLLAKRQARFSTLVIAENLNGELNSNTANSLAAATKFGEPVDVVVHGNEAQVAS